MILFKNEQSKDIKDKKVNSEYFGEKNLRKNRNNLVSYIKTRQLYWFFNQMFCREEVNSHYL